VAFALTSFQSDGIKYSGPGPRRAIQTVILTITGTTADVDLDIGDDSGTFWTAALADSTYGDLAEEALSKLQTIISNATAVARIYSPEIEASGIRAAAASGTAYTLVYQNSRPNWTFASSQGLTAYTVFIDYLLDVNILPVADSYGVGA
jgi:hypothetical protein